MNLNYNIELANMEEMADRLNLILSHIRSKHECLQMESIEEYFNSVSLYDVFSKDDSFAFNYSHLNYTEQEDKPVQRRLAKCIEVLGFSKSVDTASSFVFCGSLV